MRAVVLVSLVIAGLLPGCTESPAVGPVPVPEPAVPEDDSVDWSATVSSNYCLQAGGVRGCGSFGLAGGDTAPTYVHEADGRDLVGGTLTLEWDAATPTTETLRIVLAALTGCPDECETNQSLGSGSGKSPLTVQVPAKAYGEGLAVEVRVEIVDVMPGTQVSLDQQVHLTGTLTFVEPAASPDTTGADGSATNETAPPAGD